MTQQLFPISGAAVAALLLMVATVRAEEVGSHSAYSTLRLSSAQAQEDVSIFGRALRELHPGWDRYTSGTAMDALLLELERSTSGGVSDTDLYLDVSRILAHLRCDHTKAELPGRIEEYRKSTPSYLPFSFRLFDGRMYVDRVAKGDPEEPSRPGPLGRGNEVLSINGRPVGRVLADVAEFISVDGWTDHSKRVEMEYSSEYLGDAIDHFWPFLYGWAHAWTIQFRNLEVEEGRGAGTEGAPGAGTVQTVTIPAMTYGEWLGLATAEGERYTNFSGSVEFRKLDSETGYLSIGTFVNYREPVDPTTIFDLIFDELRAQRIGHLVIDLRSCGGGSDDVPAALASYLSDRVIPMAKRAPWVRSYDVGDLRPYLSSWDESVFHLPAELFNELGNGFYEFLAPPSPSAEVVPRSNRFEGRVTVLSSAANASGATILIALLQDRYGVRVVGEATGGSAEGPTAGVMYFLTLPNSGITVRVPALRSWTNVERPIPGMGVEPDLEIVPAVQDWLDESDPVLEAALEPARR